MSLVKILCGAGALGFVLISSVAEAQSNPLPPFVAQQPLTAAQLNAAFAAKSDYPGHTPVTSFNTRGGAVTLNSGDVTSALAFIPLNPSNNLSDVGNSASALNNLIGLPHVDSLALLEGLSTVSYKTIIRDGYLVSGDAPPLQYISGSTSCSAADGAYQVTSSDGKCWLAKFTGPIDIREWGAKSSSSFDSTSSIQAAFNAGENNGFELYIPCGGFYVTTLTASGLKAHGADQYCSSIYGTQTTGNVLYFSFNAGPSRLTDLTVDRSVTPSAGSGIYADNNGTADLERVTVQNNWTGFSLGASARSFCIQCSAQSNYADGFDFFDYASNTAMQWQMINTLSQLNNGWGYKTTPSGTGNTDTGQVFINAGSYANSSGGFDFSAGFAINDVIMTNSYSSSDGGNGFQFSDPGANIQLNGVFAELEGRLGTGRAGATPASHVGSGILCDNSGVATLSSISITGGYASQNSGSGILAFSNCAVSKLSISNFDSWGNGYYVSAIAMGYYFQSTTPAYWLSNVHANDNGNTVQLYGLNMSSGVATNTYVTGGDFSGNVTAGCNATITGGKAVVVGSGC